MATRGYEFYLCVDNIPEGYYQHEKVKFVSTSGHVMCLLYTS